MKKKTKKKKPPLISLYKPAIKQLCWKSTDLPVTYKIYGHNSRNINQCLTVKTKSNPSAENKSGWRIQTSCGSKMNHLEVFQFMCTWRYEHISTSSVIWQLYFTCRHYFSLFSTVNQICDIWYSSIHTKCQSCCKPRTGIFKPKCNDCYIENFPENRCRFYCGACWCSYTGESPCSIGLFSQLVWWKSSVPQSDVHALWDKKMNATAMGSIIINEKWHHCVVCLTAIRPLSLQHSMWSRCLFD